MVGGHERNPLVLVKPSPEKGDFFLGFQERLGGEGSQGADQPGPDGLELLDEKGLAGPDLVRLRIPVPGGRHLMILAM